MRYAPIISSKEGRGQGEPKKRGFRDRLQGNDRLIGHRMIKLFIDINSKYTENKNKLLLNFG